MNEKKLRKTIAIINFCFPLFCIIWIISSFLFLPVMEGQKNYVLMIRDPQWNFVTIMGLLSSVIIIFAVFGIYYVNRERGGVLLSTGIILLIIGLLLEMSSLTWDLFIWPVICKDELYKTFISAGVFIKSTQFNIFFIALLSFLLTGSILTAIGLMKTKKYGIFIPLLLILGIILYILGNVLLFYLSVLGLVIYSTTFFLVGLKIWKE